MACVKKLFSNNLKLGLELSIKSIFNSFEKGKVDVDKLYSSITKFLREGQQAFFFGDSEVNQEYIESVNSIKDIVLARLKNSFNKDGYDSKFYDSIVSKFDDNFAGDAGINSGSVKNNTDPESPYMENNPDMPNESERLKQSLDTIIETYYGTVIKANSYRKQQFGTDLLRSAIIDRTRRKVIKTSEDLNMAICSLKNKYLSNIVAYLKSIDSNFSGNSALYSDTFELLPGYEQTLNKFYNELKDKSDSIQTLVTEGWKKKLLGQNDLFYDALNSYVNLVYFDQMLQDTIGKVIQLSNSLYSGLEMDADELKYVFSKGDEHKRKGWENSENRDALNDIAKFSKLIISTIPIYSSLTGQFLNRYVTIGNFANAITSLFINAGSLRGNKKLQDAITNFHSNPYKYSEIIFKEITNEQTQEALIAAGMNRFNINILTSVYSYVYDTSREDSLKSIETASLKSDFSVDGYSIIDSINGVIDRTMDATYLQMVYSGKSDMIEVAPKKKFTDRKTSYNIINRINQSNISRTMESRRALSTRFPVTRGGNIRTYQVKIGNSNITATTSDQNGILSPTVITFKYPSGSLIEQVFSHDPEISKIDLVSPESIDRILSRQNLSEYEATFVEVVSFIDSFLGTRFLSKDGLDKLYLYSMIHSDLSNYIEGMLQSAVRAAVVNDLYLEFNNGLEDGRYKSVMDFKNFLTKSYVKFGEIFADPEKMRAYCSTKFGVPELISIRQNEEWIDQMNEVEAILTGEISKSTIKDINKNSIANNRTSFLGGNLKYYLGKYRGAGSIAATSSLLFTNNDSLIAGTVFNTDAQSRMGIRKSVKDMKSGELFYSSIIHNFYGNYLQSQINPDKFDKRNKFKNTLFIQPTTYSDKTTFIMYAIHGDQKLDGKKSLPNDEIVQRSYDGKTIWELNSNEIVDLYQDTIGEGYVKLYNNVLSDLRTTLKKLKEIREKQGNPHPVLSQYTDESISNFTGEAINDVLHTISQEELLDAAAEARISLQLDTHYRKSGDSCKLNELLYHYATDLYVNKESLLKRFEIEKTNFLNDLLLSGVNFYTAYYDSEDAELSRGNSSNIVSKIINKLYKGEDLPNYKKNWISGNKLILAKVDGKPITSRAEIEYGHDIELNPLLEKYFYTDSLLSNNLRLELTGSEVAHPDKAKIDFTDELERANITPRLNPEYFKQKNPFSNPNNQIIFAHPGIGKTYSITNGKFKDKFIDWDVEFNALRDKFIFDHYGIRKGTDEFQDFLRNQRSYDDYLKFLDNNWRIIRDRAKSQGKILLVSPSILLERHSQDFNYIIDMSQDDFVQRDTARRGSTEENSRNWKQDIDNVISRNPNIPRYTIQQGKYLEDLFIEAAKPEAIDNFKDLIWLKNEAKLHPILQKVFDRAIIRTEAVAQGTQLKRNVIIPATLQYEQQKVLNGIPAKLKVAIISDVQAKIFNFRGDSAKEDAHDGSAWINPFISLLENKSLQDQEVGVDKKPIWHSFNPNLMAATLLKFASFTITNERMRTSLNSNMSLYNLFKKMTNLQWSTRNADGTEVWNNSRGESFNLVNTKGLKKNQYDKIQFFKDILNTKPLYYEENGLHYQIVDFGFDEASGYYYTDEAKVSNTGSRLGSNKTRVYHAFDSKSNHFKFKDALPPTEGFHRINSLFELFSALGGVYSEELAATDSGTKTLRYSDDSSRAVVNFMNNVSIRTGNDSNNLSQDTYYQPLKEMMISYAANTSAVKNGAANINGEGSWMNDKALRYMELDSDGLGIQMDADHTIDESEMTEFSQVISALEAGGRLHHLTKQVYNTLGYLAVQASKIEIDAVAKYISAKNKGIPLDKIKSELYDILGRTFISHFKQKEDRIELATPIIVEIRKKFNLSDDHSLDEFLIPFSDSNVYGNVISAFVSNINSKSIKRKYPGSGCVMIPGYNIIQNFKYNDKINSFDDVLKEARRVNRKEKFYEDFNGSNIVEYNRSLVNAYLQKIQSEYDKNATTSLEGFIPTDIIDVLYEEGGILKRFTVDTNGIEDYYSFKENPIGYISNKILERDGRLPDLSKGVRYVINVTKPRNLAPARIWWEWTDENGTNHVTNIFDTEPVRESFLRRNDPNFDSVANREKIQEMFDSLDKNVYIYKGKEYKVTNLHNEAAELVISNMYASKFNTRGKSISEVLQTGPDFFKSGELDKIYSSNYDIVFTTNNGKHQYISFRNPRPDKENAYRPKDIGWKDIRVIGNDTYATTKDGQILFKVGTNIIRKDLTFVNNQFKNKEGAVIGDPNLRVNSNGQVVEYVEFLSNWKVTEKKAKGRLQSYYLYVVNPSKIKKAQYNATEESINEQIAKILSDVYGANSYNAVRINYKMSGRSAIMASQILPKLRLTGKVKDLVNLTVGEYLSNINPELPTFKISNEDKYNEMLEDYYDQFAEEIFASFEKSLTFTASRIPAQTLQSFMQMRAVGFTLSSKNIAYVSHWQTW